MVYCIVLKYTLFIMLYQTIFPYVVLCFFSACCFGASSEDESGSAPYPPRPYSYGHVEALVCGIAFEGASRAAHFPSGD